MKKLSLFMTAFVFLWMLANAARTAAQDACPQPLSGTPAPFEFESSFLMESDLEGMAAAQILAYLNQVGSADGLVQALDVPISDEVFVFAVDVITADVTGDGAAEVLVQFGVSYGGYGGYNGMILLFGCEDGAFVQQHIETFYGWTCPDEFYGFARIADLNQNGTAEVYHFYVSNAGTGGCYSTMRVYEWNGQALTRATWEWEFTGSDGAYDDCGYYLYVTSETRTLDEGGGFAARFLDANGDGVDELFLIDRADRGIGINYECAEVWTWSTPDALDLICAQRYALPSEFAYRIELLATAEDALSCGLFAGALDHYRDVITADVGEFNNNSADERAYLTAFAYYRLVQLEVIRGDRLRAAEDFTRLQWTFPEGTPGHEYAAMTRVFWEIYQGTGDIGEACDVVNIYADEHRATPLEDRSIGYYFSNGYDMFELAPDNLYLGCP